MNPVATFDLSAPARVSVQTPDGGTVEVDVYEARRALAKADADSGGDEQRRWEAVLYWLGQKLGIGREQLAENQAIEFNDLIVTVVERLNADRKKKIDSIAFSPGSIPASPPATEPGP